jgi:hypothetical protein
LLLVVSLYAWRVDVRGDSFNNDTLVQAVAHHEGWSAEDHRRFQIVRDRINGAERVEEAFLILRGGTEPLIERAAGVASWPRWETQQLGGGDTPILDALAMLANRLTSLVSE